MIIYHSSGAGVVFFFDICFCFLSTAFAFMDKSLREKKVDAESAW